jgi:hypothetical protein
MTALEMVFWVLFFVFRGFVGCSALTYVAPQLGGLDQNQKILLSKTVAIVFSEFLPVSLSIAFLPGKIRGGCALSVWRACFSWATLH